MSNITKPELDNEANHGKTKAGKAAKTRKNGRKKRITIIVLAVILLLAAGIGAYSHITEKAETEQKEYRFASGSTDPTVLQMYLNNFKDAPQEHREAISNRLNTLLEDEREWNNVIVNGTKAALKAYIATYPNSFHRQEALKMLDSLDWDYCLKTASAEAFQDYLDNHSGGNHYEEAVIALKKIKSEEVSDEERASIRDIFRNFFVSINIKDERRLTADMGDYVTFLGRQNASKGDIVEFMHRLYKDDVSNMLWRLADSCAINKKEIGKQLYEYAATIMAEQEVTKTDGTETKSTYRINATVNPDGKITEMAMTRILE